MSRLKDALMSLLGKCTPEGTQPVGNNTDEILECMAMHFDVVKASRLLVNVTEANGVYTADKSYDEIKKAIENGFTVMCAYDERIFYLTRFRSGGAIFCTLGYTYNDDAAIIETATIYSIRIKPANNIVFYSKALS